ncbi:hypothetical protein JTE90_016180 [Oedothorax gibbosus]|uniref:Autophagy protein ATG17-like domain-containing protein n=1 Tax=Oedothorax gibbosus TaxID=931172 RepID=A0AAV6USK0_9ARAC|nr:hypothetical protein JTE90_016180 [Oedothorax gibbosus]
MLYVFIVPTGTILNLDMNLAVKKVLELKNEIFQLVNIAVEDQVLLCSGGEELKNENIVGNYSGAGTDTNPIFLFSLKEISLPFSEKTSIDLTIENKVKDCANMKPSLTAITVRRSLAQQLAELSGKGKKECSDLVHQQHLQQQGWAAVIANLEDAKDCVVKRKQQLDELFENFLANRDYYQDIIKMFPEDIALLSKVPVLTKLLILNGSECSKEDLEKEHTLLTWFCSEPQHVLDLMVEKCQHSLDKLHENSLMFLNQTFTEVIEQAESPDYREVKGIEKRLASLNHISETTAKLCKDQNELIITLESSDRINQARDPNVLPDVCTWYQSQLELMLKNYKPIIDMLSKCKAAKIELSLAINCLIPHICKLESDILKLHRDIGLYENYIKSVTNKIDSFRQVHLAPQRYLKTLAEVCRRKEFSANFIKWATELSEKASKLYEKETSFRKDFNKLESKNMVDNLFCGLDDMPPPYAVEGPPSFDLNLPDVSKEDLDQMKSLFPTLAHLCEVIPPDPMPFSTHTGSDSAFSSNIPSSLKIVSHIFEGTDLCESQKALTVSLTKASAPSPDFNSEFASNEVFSFTSSNTSDIENIKTRRTRTSSLISFAAEAILEEKHPLSVDSASEEFETVEHYGTLPVEISSHSSRRHFRHTSSSDIAGGHKSNSLKISRARSDGDAISPMQERLKSSDSMDFQSAEYYIDDSMPSSYSESNATSPLMRGSRMVKSHHVVVAELQRQLEEKSAALASTSSSLETSHSNILKVHAKMSTLQKFIEELQGTLQSDLSHLKEFVKDELTDRMTDAADIVEKINSCVALMHKQMLIEKDEAVTEAKKDFVSIENAYRHRLEVESQKLNDAETQIAHYEEHLLALTSRFEDSKHENEQLINELQDKKELLKKVMLEHELEFDSFKTQIQDTIQNKDSRISELQQALSDSLYDATKLKQEKLDVQTEFDKNLQKKQAVIDELQLDQRALKEKIDKCQGCARSSKELKDMEKKFQETLQEKNRYMKESNESYKNLLRCKAEGDKSRNKALKELEDKLICKHKNDMESLRSRFRMAVSTTYIERPSSPEPPMDAEAFAGMEDLKKDMTESCRKLKEEKARELEKLKREIEAKREQQKQAQMKKEEEHKKRVASLQLEHEQALEKLKSRITAESQVSFNEAIKSVAKEKDNIIACLRAKVTTLDTELYNIKSHLQKYLPSRESISQSHSGSICRVPMETQQAIEETRVVESLFQQQGAMSQSQQPSQSCSESHENVKRKHKAKEASPKAKEATPKAKEATPKAKEATPKEQEECVVHQHLMDPCLECKTKISILKCTEGDLVLLRYEERHQNFAIFHFGVHPHFLHSDSLQPLNLKIRKYFSE